MGKIRQDDYFNEYQSDDYDPDGTIDPIVLACPSNLNTIFTPSAKGKILVPTSISLRNATGGTIFAGVGPNLDNTKWNAGQIDAAGVFIDDTIDAQDSDAGDFAISALVINTGHILGASELWSLSEYNVSTIHAGAPIYEFNYWNGTAWIALTTLSTPAFGTLGKSYLAFLPPSDWTKGGSGTGVNQANYNIRVRTTTAPTAAALATTLDIMHALKVPQPSITTLEAATFKARPFPLSKPKDRNGEPIVAFFSVANTANLIVLVGNEEDAE